MESGKVKAVIVAEDVDKPEIIKLIEALGRDRDVDVYKFESKESLGEFCGFCKVNDKGEVRRVKNCACLGFTSLGVDPEMQIKSG